MADDNAQQPPAGVPLQLFTLVLHKVIDVPNVGPRLMVAMQVQGPGGIPLSHMIEMPGEVLVAVIQSLTKLTEEFPQFTKDLSTTASTTTLGADDVEKIRAQQQENLGLVDATGAPISSKPNLKVVKH